MTALTIKPKDRCKYDILSLGEVMIRLDPGDNRIHTTRQFKVWEGGGESFNSRLRDECLNMELFYGLRDARVTIENYRCYYNEHRLHGALDDVPPVEFKQQWLAEHPEFILGALPPNPRDLSLWASKQKTDEERRTATEGYPASAPMADRRSGCVPAEPYPPTDRIIIGNFNP